MRTERRQFNDSFEETGDVFPLYSVCDISALQNRERRSDTRDVQYFVFGKWKYAGAFKSTLGLPPRLPDVTVVDPFELRKQPA